MRKILLVVMLVALTAGVARTASDQRGTAWVDEQVQLGALRDEEVPLDRIAWAESLPQALELARRHHRLVYLNIDRGDVAKGRA